MREGVEWRYLDQTWEAISEGEERGVRGAGCAVVDDGVVVVAAGGDAGVEVEVGVVVDAVGV